MNVPEEMRRSYYEKGLRYYTLLLQRDLLGDWVVIRVNGRKKSKLGRMRTDVCQSYDDALQHYEKLCTHRINARHYYLIESQ